MIGNPFAYDNKHPWVLQRNTSCHLKEWLDANSIPYRPTRTDYRMGNWCLEVQRFQLWTYWRPLTVQKFNQMTLYFEGPCCPIFASRLKYKYDDQYVYEGFDFNMRRNHHYESRSFYFVIPEFLLYRPWPNPHDWRWQPAVRVSKSVVRDILWLELEYGGWPRNKRGNKLIPRKTGCAGVKEEIESGAGWATYLGQSNYSSSTIKQRDLFNEG